MTGTRFAVSVPGGELAVGRWGAGPVVLAAHGITANHRSWAMVANALGPDVTLVAPDLRGRGDSASVGGPFGMAAHADDLTRVLDHLEVERAVVAGHSMGGFVASVMASRHADRVTALVLVDGGPPVPVEPGATIDETLDAVIGPAMQRLAMTFPSREAHLDFWRAHPALAANWSPALEEYLHYDLRGEPPALRSSVSIDAVRADAEDTLVGDTLDRATRGLRVPATWLRAERGMLDQPVGLYPDDWAAKWCAEVPLLQDVVVTGTNHYTILLSPRGATAVSAAIRDACAGS